MPGHFPPGKNTNCAFSRFFLGLFLPEEGTEKGTVTKKSYLNGYSNYLIRYKNSIFGGENSSLRMWSTDSVSPSSGRNLVH